MRTRTWARITVAGLLLGGALAASPGVGGARPGAPQGPPGIGARSLGDPLLPQLGNGGYDVSHYKIELDYDPVANRFNSARTTIKAVATQALREFSLDFQDDLTVAGVTVDGRPAAFSSEAATPDLSPLPEVTQPMKLVVRPHPSTWPKPRRAFTVVVTYSGTPQPITDPDTSIEGWIPACYPLNPPQTCDGAFVVGEPMGSQSWFPSNNYPTDKATFETVITVPSSKVALGVGELARRIDHGNGTSTWHWREKHPTATYLVTATVGDFDLAIGKITVGRKRLPEYNAVDSSATPAQRAAIDAALAQVPGQLALLHDVFGPYPFSSIGAVADRAAGVGYALEVQTKPHYAGSFVAGNPSINVATQLHELAHQWMGNSVTLSRWNVLWFNEGWATWSEWYWDFVANGGPDPAAVFDELYASTPAEDWEIAPAVLDGDPANLFLGFPTYDRSAMTLQGFREIVGDAKFAEFARTLARQFAYGNISTEQFVKFAKECSGFRGARLALLDQYFQQWLYGEVQPTIVPESFTGAPSPLAAQRSPLDALTTPRQHPRLAPSER